MKIKRPLLILTGGMVFGETAALLSGKLTGITWLISVVVLFLFYRREGWRGSAFLYALTLEAGFLLGVFSMTAASVTLDHTEQILLGNTSAQGKETVLSGIIQEEGERKDGKLYYLDHVTLMSQEGGEIRLKGKIALYRKDGTARIGNRVRAEGKVIPSPAPRNPGEYHGRYADRSKGIAARMKADSLEILSDRRSLYSLIREPLLRVQEEAAEKLLLAAGGRAGGILSAVLLGDKSHLDPELYQKYQKGGIAHLLAISGLHMSVIGAGIFRGLRAAGSGRTTAAVISGSVLILYGILTGGSPSVFRAVMMLILCFTADVIGRTYDLLTALSLSAFVLLLRHPYLITQASFQLSFLAVAGIGLLGLPLIRQYPSLREHPVFCSFLTGIAIQIFTLPASLYHSFEIPLYGIFLNLIVIPPMTIVLYSGLLTLALSGAGMKMAVFCSGGARVILLCYEKLLEITEKLPCASVLVGRPSIFSIFVYFLIILVILADRERNRKKPDRKKMYFHAGAILTAVLILVPAPPGGMVVTFLDVGQGDGILIQYEGKVILTDVGSTQKQKLGELTLVPLLKSKGISTIHTSVITHGDKDHYSGILYVLEHPEEGIRVETVMLPKAGKGVEIYETLEKSALKAGAQVVYAETGDQIVKEMVCLYPDGDRKCESRNEESLVFQVEYGRFRMLLTGDIEADAEKELADSGKLSPVTVLKACHHGSSSSSGQEFLDLLSPCYTILSYGEGNRYGHPHKEVVSRIEKTKSILLRTAECGAIEIKTDGNRIRVRSFRNDPF